MAVPFRTARVNVMFDVDTLAELDAMLADPEVCQTRSTFFYRHAQKMIAEWKRHKQQLQSA